MSRIALDNLLNPVEEIDARPQLQILRDLLAKAPPGEILVPSELRTSLNNMIETLTRLSIGPEALRDALLPTRTVQETIVEHDIFINRQTELATLYRYPPNTYIEYPETGEEAIGHLFQIDPEKNDSPNLDFAYSQGKPAGQSRKTEEVFCPLLVDYNGELVRCIKRYSTCQGMKYLEAIFSNNLDAIKQIEEAACLLDYGPLALCSFVANFSSKKLNCPTEHRDRENNNKLYQPALVRLEYKARFRIFEPVEDARRSCPFVLVICQGEHHHPIPLPEKTPPKVRAEIFELLESVGEDLADLTPRSFLRHPAVLSHLRAKFPDVQNPTLSHLHSSLTNRSHLNMYISQAKMMHFPKGTDWEGIIHRKEFLDANVDPADHYIRKILDIEDDTLAQHEEDEPPAASHQNKT
ncbi:hypothetical protein DFH06DRAFT_1335487 [Mycena polygramma]|nr:hypothetical protein DFH06DRAFT_1335487 [Mycena polygramma]